MLTFLKRILAVPCGFVVKTAAWLGKLLVAIKDEAKRAVNSVLNSLSEKDGDSFVLTGLKKAGTDAFGACLVFLLSFVTCFLLPEAGGNHLLLYRVYQVVSDLPSAITKWVVKQVHTYIFNYMEVQT